MELATRCGPGFELWQGCRFTTSGLAYRPIAKRTALDDSEDRGDVCRRGGGRHNSMRYRAPHLQSNDAGASIPLRLMKHSPSCHRIVPPPYDDGPRDRSTVDKRDNFDYQNVNHDFAVEFFIEFFNF